MNRARLRLAFVLWRRNFLRPYLLGWTIAGLCASPGCAGVEAFLRSKLP